MSNSVHAPSLEALLFLAGIFSIACVGNPTPDDDVTNDSSSESESDEDTATSAKDSEMLPLEEQPGCDIAHFGQTSSSQESLSFQIPNPIGD